MQTNKQKTLLILLTKFPEPDNVKTRLGKKIWMQQAALLHQACLEKLTQTHLNQEYDFQVHLKPYDRAKELCTMLDIDQSKILPQQWKDLWAIMNNALRQGLQTHEKVLLIGSDIPLLSDTTVTQAIGLLDHTDVVLWPSEDGGYYLIWAKQHLPKILTNITYSTDQVLEQTLERIEENSMRYKLLETMNDIDTYEDLLEARKKDSTQRIANTRETVTKRTSS